MPAPDALEHVTELPALPPRPADGHKGTFGRVTIIAGSRGMTGAASLAGAAALRGGAGLVTVASPASMAAMVAGYEPSYLTLPLPDDDGKLSLAALTEILQTLETQTAAAIGPGLGQSSDLDELVGQVYRAAELPMIFDADALNALSHRGSAFGSFPPPAPRILTPHPGEFARLSGHSVDDIADRREELTAAFAAEHHVIIVLKGRRTVITDGRRLAVNITGNSGLATGGTGDVLTGLMAALLAQHMEPFAAAQLAVFVHGLAGDLAAKELSQPGLIASDLPRYIALAWRQLGQ